LTLPKRLFSRGLFSPGLSVSFDLGFDGRTGFGVLKFFFVFEIAKK
jgi:hypothetical protein